MLTSEMVGIEHLNHFVKLLLWNRIQLHQEQINGIISLSIRKFGYETNYDYLFADFMRDVEIGQKSGISPLI